MGRFSKEQINTKEVTYDKCTHTQKKKLYIYLYIYVGKSAFLRISLARIYAVLCAGRRDVLVCVRERTPGGVVTMGHAQGERHKLSSPIPRLHGKAKEKPKDLFRPFL